MRKKWVRDDSLIFLKKLLFTEPFSSHHSYFEILIISVLFSNKAFDYFKQAQSCEYKASCADEHYICTEWLTVSIREPEGAVDF